MKKIFLKVLMGSLILSALIGIVIFLFGSLDSFEGDVLFTTSLIGAFSITGLCCAAIYDNPKYRLFSTIGIVLNVIGCLYFIMLTWDIISFDTWDQTELLLKTVITTILLTLSFAHMSLLLLINVGNNIVNKTRMTTFVFSIILDLMILILLWTINDIPEFFYRLIGVIAIITTLGTILIPILNRIYKDNN